MASRTPIASSVVSGFRRMEIIVGRPSVIVPVLSNTTNETFPIFSRAEASLMRMWFSAALPMPTVIAVGVASPRAQGQAMTSTDTAQMIALGSNDEPPTASHIANVAKAMHTTTAAKYLLTVSAIFWTGALLPCASRTVSTICERSVAFMGLSTATIILPEPLIVPAYT